MARLIVRNIEEEVMRRLRGRAAAHARSLEKQVRDILRNAVKDSAWPSVRLGTSLRARFAAIGQDEDIPELSKPALPADFDK